MTKTIIHGKTIALTALAILSQITVPGAIRQANAQADKTPYPAMAPLDQYLTADYADEDQTRAGR
jgi:hypothetical protein